MRMGNLHERKLSFLMNMHLHWEPVCFYASPGLSRLRATARLPQAQTASAEGPSMLGPLWLCSSRTTSTWMCVFMGSC